VWNLLFFVFNGAAFVLIGLQLRGIVHGLSAYPLATLIGWSLAIALAVIAVRYVWMFPAAYGRRALFPKVREVEGPDPPWQWVFVLSTAGMRGIVSLAAALALPLAAQHGAPFPARDAIVFITFVVIFVTLVGQGLTLIPLVEWLGLGRAGEGDAREIEVRVAALEAGLRKIEEMRATVRGQDEREVIERLADEYAHRIDHLRTHHVPGFADETAESHFDHDAQEQAVRAERAAIMQLRDRGEIPDEIFRRVQYDLDLAESRLF
jgi:CPA1 family monovalent cation:H+ antiporter